MPGSGTRTFLEPDHYEAGLRQAQIELVITPCCEFKARLVWVELQHLQVLRCEEDIPRLGYMCLPPRLAYISFPASSGPLSRWRGTEMQAADIMLHSLGDRLHQWTPGPSIWSVIALDPAQLERYGAALAGRAIFLPREGRVLRASQRDAARLRRLHAQACRLAETKPKLLAHPQVARAIEDDLLQALVSCLTSDRMQEEKAGNRRHATIMLRFEEALAEHLSGPVQIRELCELIGVSDQTLRLRCAEFLGISPSRYVLLRRLKEVRRTLRDADPNMASVAKLARGYGFAEWPVLPGNTARSLAKAHRRR